MALDRSKFSCVLQCSYGGEVWMYGTADAKATVIAANYFLPVQAQLQNNDRIHCWTGIGGSVDYCDLAVLVSSPATVTVVSLASMT